MDNTTKLFKVGSRKSQVKSEDTIFNLFDFGFSIISVGLFFTPILYILVKF
jgi:hypothetical protein